MEPRWYTDVISGLGIIACPDGWIVSTPWSTYTFTLEEVQHVVCQSETEQPTFDGAVSG